MERDALAARRPCQLQSAHRLNLAVPVEAPRRRDKPEIVVLRSMLLFELGVSEAEDDVRPETVPTVSIGPNREVPAVCPSYI